MRATKNRHVYMFPLLAVLLAGCLENIADTVGERELTTPMYQLKVALHEGDHQRADNLIADLKDNSSVNKCELAWAGALSGVLSTIDRINGYVRLIPSSAPGYQPAAINGNTQIRNIIGPFEDEWLQIVSNARQVVDEGCSFEVPGGVPFAVGTEGKLIYAQLVLGDVWSPPVARLMISSFLSLQTVVDFVLSHNLIIDNALTDEALPYASDVQKALQDQEKAAADSVTPVTFSYVSSIRPYGAIFDVAPELLGFAKFADDRSRFDRIPDTLAEILTTLYDRTSAGESGVIPDLIGARLSPAEASGAVLGFVDEDQDTKVSTGDRIVLGIRRVNIASTFVLPSSPYGIELYIPVTLGNVGTMVEAIHDTIRILGDQAESVHNTALTPERLGLDPLNRLISANETLSDTFGAVPEALEINIANYFGSAEDPARPLRDYLPYWYDDDNAIETLDVFMIEGESNEIFSDPITLVSRGDSGHFPASFQWGTVVDIPAETVTDAHIDADLVTALESFKNPVPYVGWQDPSFHGVVWADPSKLPDIGALYTPGFEPADQHSINLLTNWYLRFVLDSSARSFNVPLP